MFLMMKVAAKISNYILFYFILIFIFSANVMDSDLSNSVKNGILYLEDTLDKVGVSVNFLLFLITIYVRNGDPISLSSVQRNCITQKKRR